MYAYMFQRPFWINRIAQAWKEAPIVWLSGVRRTGKTTLVQSLGPDRIQYVNCDLPQVEDETRNPELFYRNCTRPVIVFDEIHQLKDPSRLLKIGADLFPNLRLLATGSSTLVASRKFKDTLTGRKRTVHLTPVLWNELETFNHSTLLRRLFHGGLPSALLSETKPLSFYREWMDSFFARDIQQLYAFRDATKFIALFEYLLKQSGGLLEVTRTAGALGVGRPTVEHHLQALETTHAVTLVRPFHGGGQKELVKMPKVYGFDSGFVSFCRGWDPLRTDDCGALWEHLVLETLQAYRPDSPIQYWRDASGREIDFVLPGNRNRVDAVECKWNQNQFDPTALKVFRTYYPEGVNYVISPITSAPYTTKAGGLDVHVCNPDGWSAHASGS
jgi:hypothetical protein